MYCVEFSVKTKPSAILGALSIFFYLLVTLNTAAQQVAVVGEVGQAFLFKHLGNCYAVLPDHVTRRSGISLISSSPVVHGNGVIHFHSDKSTDLAIAYVQGPITRRCRRRWSNLPRDLTALLESRNDGYILIVRETGTLVRMPVTIAEYNHYTITAKLKNQSQRTHVSKGMSGAVLFVGDIPVGIVRNGSEESGLLAFRMDEVVLRLKRWMEGAADKTVEASKEVEASRAIVGSGSSFPFRIAFWNTAAIGADNTVQNLEKGATSQPYIVPWTGTPVTFIIELPSNRKNVIRSIEILSDPRDQRFTIPKTVRIRADASQGASRFWRTIYSPEMPPNGILRVPIGGTSARRFEITVSKVWNSKKALRLDRIIVK